MKNKTRKEKESQTESTQSDTTDRIEESVQHREQPNAVHLTEQSPVQPVQIVGQLKAEDLHVDPDYERRISRPSEFEYVALKASMMRDGQRDAIIVNPRGIILDGHTRFKICQELKMKPRFEIREFRGMEDEMIFILESAIARRNMNDFQRIEAAQIFFEIEKSRAAERRRLGKKQTTTLASFGAKVGKASQIVADRIGVSKATFERGCFIIDHASPVQIWDLEQRLSFINTTYSLLKQKKTQIAENGPQGETSQENARPPTVDKKGNAPELEESAKQRKNLPKKKISSNSNGEIHLECCHCHESFPVSEMYHICESCVDGMLGDA